MKACVNFLKFIVLIFCASILSINYSLRTPSHGLNKLRNVIFWWYYFPLFLNEPYRFVFICPLFDISLIVCRKPALKIAAFGGPVSFQIFWFCLHGGDLLLGPPLRFTVSRSSSFACTVEILLLLISSSIK